MNVSRSDRYVTNLDSATDLLNQMLREKYGDEIPEELKDLKTIRRFLIARKCDVVKAETMIVDHLEWRRTRFPILRKEFCDGKFLPRPDPSLDAARFASSDSARPVSFTCVRTQIRSFEQGPSRFEVKI